MNTHNEMMASVKDLSYIAPEYTDYEDAYTMAMDERYPVRYIISGTTKPFPHYKNKRPPTRKHHIFEYVISGKGYIYLNGGWHTLTGGCMYIVDKDDERNFYSDPKDPMHKIWVTFSSDYIDVMMSNYGVRSGVYTADVYGHFNDIYGIAKGSLPEREKMLAVADGIHKIILAAASSKAVEKEPSVGLRIENELSASIYRKLSLDELAKKLFISRAHLIRLFKAHKGMTPYQFLLEEKIKIARALLSTTEMSVKSISDKLCFADEHYFSHLFKEKVGLSPLKYKATKKIIGS